MDIKDLRNSHNGRIFLIGNGPSLEDTPLHLMKDEYTFGVNGIPEIFNQTDWRPSFYAAVDERVEKEYCEKASDLNIPCFFPHYFNHGLEGQNIITLRSHYLVDVNDNVEKLGIEFEKIDDYQSVFSKNIGEVTYVYNSVMYYIIQIANYMGFNEMYLVGNDLYDVIDEYLIFPEAADPDLHRGCGSRINTYISFLRKDGNMVKSFANGVAYKLLTSNYMGKIFNKTNYFTDQYDSNIVFTTRNNHIHILAHRLAKRASKQMNFKIYNATIGGQLEVHPRRNLYNIL